MQNGLLYKNASWIKSECIDREYSADTSAGNAGDAKKSVHQWSDLVGTSHYLVMQRGKATSKAKNYARNRTVISNSPSSTARKSLAVETQQSAQNSSCKMSYFKSVSSMKAQDSQELILIGHSPLKKTDEKRKEPMGGESKDFYSPYYTKQLSLVKDETQVGGSKKRHLQEYRNSLKHQFISSRPPTVGQSEDFGVIPSIRNINMSSNIPMGNDVSNVISGMSSLHLQNTTQTLRYTTLTSQNDIVNSTEESSGRLPSVRNGFPVSSAKPEVLDLLNGRTTITPPSDPSPITPSDVEYDSLQGFHSKYLPCGKAKITPLANSVTGTKAKSLSLESDQDDVDGSLQTECQSDFRGSTPTSVSSLASSKKLEWDNGADIGYGPHCKIPTCRPYSAPMDAFRSEPEGISTSRNVNMPFSKPPQTVTLRHSAVVDKNTQTSTLNLQNQFYSGNRSIDSWIISDPNNFSDAATSSDPARDRDSADVSIQTELFSKKDIEIQVNPGQNDPSPHSSQWSLSTGSTVRPSSDGVQVASPSSAGVNHTSDENASDQKTAMPETVYFQKGLLSPTSQPMFSSLDCLACREEVLNERKAQSLPLISDIFPYQPSQHCIIPAEYYTHNAGSAKLLRSNSDCSVTVPSDAATGLMCICSENESGESAKRYFTQDISHSTKSETSTKYSQDSKIQNSKQILLDLAESQKSRKDSEFDKFFVGVDVCNECKHDYSENPPGNSDASEKSSISSGDATSVVRNRQGDSIPKQSEIRNSSHKQHILSEALNCVNLEDCFNKSRRNSHSEMGSGHTDTKHDLQETEDKKILSSAIGAVPSLPLLGQNDSSFRNKSSRISCSLIETSEVRKDPLGASPCHVTLPSNKIVKNVKYTSSSCIGSDAEDSQILKNALETATKNSQHFPSVSSSKELKSSSQLEMDSCKPYDNAIPPIIEKHSGRVLVQNSEAKITIESSGGVRFSFGSSSPLSNSMREFKRLYNNRLPTPGVYLTLSNSQSNCLYCIKEQEHKLKQDLQAYASSSKSLTNKSLCTDKKTKKKKTRKSSISGSSYPASTESSSKGTSSSHTTQDTNDWSRSTTSEHCSSSDGASVISAVKEDEVRGSNDTESTKPGGNSQPVSDDPTHSGHPSGKFHKVLQQSGRSVHGFVQESFTSSIRSDSVHNLMVSKTSFLPTEPGFPSIRCSIQDSTISAIRPPFSSTLNRAEGGSIFSVSHLNIATHNERQFISTPITSSTDAQRIEERTKNEKCLMEVKSGESTCLMSDKPEVNNQQYKTATKGHKKREIEKLQTLVERQKQNYRRRLRRELQRLEQLEEQILSELEHHASTGRRAKAFAEKHQTLEAKSQQGKQEMPPFKTSLTSHLTTTVVKDLNTVIDASNKLPAPAAKERDSITQASKKPLPSESSQKEGIKSETKLKEPNQNTINTQTNALDLGEVNIAPKKDSSTVIHHSRETQTSQSSEVPISEHISIVRPSTCILISHELRDQSDLVDILRAPSSAVVGKLSSPKRKQQLRMKSKKQSSTASRKLSSADIVKPVKKSVAWFIPCVTTNSSVNDEEAKSPKITSSTYYCEECFTCKTLQEAFYKHCGHLIKRSESRLQRIAHLAEVRRRKTSAALRRARLAKSAPRNKVLSKIPAGNFEPRNYTHREMREQTERLYQMLPEVLLYHENKKKEEQHKMNRLMAHLFKKKLQEQALKGRVSWTITQSCL